MRIITQRRDIDQLLKEGVLDQPLAESLTTEWLAMAEGVLGGDPPGDDEDLRECMTTVLLEPGDDWTKIGLLRPVPSGYLEGIPWDDAARVNLGNGQAMFFGHSVCSDWHVLAVFQSSNSIPEAFAAWFSDAPVD